MKRGLLVRLTRLEARVERPAPAVPDLWQRIATYRAVWATVEPKPPCLPSSCEVDLITERYLAFRRALSANLGNARVKA